MSKKAVPAKPTRSCVLTRWVTSVLLFVVAVAALVGVYQTHVLTGDGVMHLQFGSTSGSLSIMAFVVALYGWKKSVYGCCGGGANK